MKCLWSAAEFRGQPDQPCIRPIVLPYEPGEDYGPGMESVFCPFHLVWFEMISPGHDQRLTLGSR